MIYAINLIQLREGVPVEEFESFSRSLDQPTCLAQHVVQSFEAYTVDRPVFGQALPAQIIEIMALKSWRGWERTRNESAALRPVGERFAELADPALVSVSLLKRICRRDEEA